MKSLKNWRFPLALFVTSMVIGVSGYMWIEGYALSEAFYMTVITLFYGR